MTHHVFSVSAADKADVVRELASGQDRSLLFMRPSTPPRSWPSS
jgi:hypothetical protein